MNQRLTTSIAALALAVSGVAAAQEQATVLKRDGTRVSGRFEAWNRDTNTLFLRLSLADQRKLPVGEVAVFEVAGNAENLPANEIEAARGSDHVLVLRNGEVLRGRLLNIEGGEGSGKEDEPRTLSFKPNDAGEKRAPFPRCGGCTSGTSRHRSLLRHPPQSRQPRRRCRPARFGWRPMPAG